MNFVIVRPETAGYPVSFQPIACRFDTWLGDDIVRAHPLLLGLSMREATMCQYRPRPGAPPGAAERRRVLPHGGD